MRLIDLVRQRVSKTLLQRHSDTDIAKELSSVFEEFHAYRVSSIRRAVCTTRLDLRVKRFLASTEKHLKLTKEFNKMLKKYPDAKNGVIVSKVLLTEAGTGYSKITLRGYLRDLQQTGRIG